METHVEVNAFFEAFKINYRSKLIKSPKKYNDTYENNNIWFFKFCLLQSAFERLKRDFIISNIKHRAIEKKY
jgi:hypothetical protein